MLFCVPERPSIPPSVGCQLAIAWELPMPLGIILAENRPAMAFIAEPEHKQTSGRRNNPKPQQRRQGGHYFCSIRSFFFYFRKKPLDVTFQLRYYSITQGRKTIMKLDDLTLDVEQHVDVQGSLDDVFKD